MSALDEKLLQIDERLREIDSEIGRLSTLKRKLSAAKEQLQDQKYLEQHNQLAKNDWSQGKIGCDPRRLHKLIINFQNCILGRKLSEKS